MNRILPLRLPVVLVAAALLAAGVPSGPAVAADATPTPTPQGATWAVQPADESGPDGRVSLRHTIDPGSVVDDRIALTNFGPRPATFAVYASDGTITADGDFDLIPNDEPATDGGSWIGFGDLTGAAAREGGGLLVEVPEESVLLIPVQIAVPENATPGDHPAGIVAELVPDAGSGVQFASRVGVRAHLRVSGDIVPALVPEAVTASYTPSWNPFAPGTVTVTYTLSNAGNVRLGAEADTTVAGPLGLAAASATSQQREILPGTGGVVIETMAVWPLFFAWGDVDAQPLTVGEDEIDGPLPAAATSFGVWAVPWSQLLLIALLAGAVALFLRTRKRSQQRIQARIDAAVAAATAAGAPSSSSSADPTGSAEASDRADATERVEATATVEEAGEQEPATR